MPNFQAFIGGRGVELGMDNHKGLGMPFNSFSTAPFGILSPTSYKNHEPRNFPDGSRFANEVEKWSLDGQMIL